MSATSPGAVPVDAAERVPLVVLHDERCPLCRRLKAWLGSQATLAPIEYVAADSPEAHRRFPGLDHLRTTTVLTMVRGDGAVYEGERAWLVAAWLLPRWQAVAEHLSTPARLRLVRLGARLIDIARVASSPDPGPYGSSCERCRIVAPPPRQPGGGQWPPPGSDRSSRR